MGHPNLNGEHPPQKRPSPIFKHIITYVANISLVFIVLDSCIKSYTASQITALEHQLGISSTDSGFLVSCSEIGYLSSVFFITHFGSRRRVPRVLAVTTILAGLTSIVIGLLNFISPVSLANVDALYNSTSNDGSLCSSYVVAVKNCSADLSSSSSSSSSSGAAGGGKPTVYTLIVVATVMRGIWMSSTFSLGISYVDNNAKNKHHSSLYMAIIWTVASFGPAIALGLGSVVSRIPVDLSDTILNPYHPQWIGAWWIGFLVFGSVTVLFGIPLFLFPKHIKEADESAGNQVNNRGEQATSLLEEAKDLPRSVYRVLRNPVVSCLLAGSCSVLFALSGSQAFAPKYVETQFSMPAFQANMTVGLEQLAWAATGVLLGGIVTSKLKLSNKGCLKLILLSATISALIYILHLFFGCDNQDIRGMGDSRLNMTSAITCHCGAEQEENFLPICGADQVTSTYFSPCVAGCISQNETGYFGCSEIAGGEATAGMCPSDCPFLYPYLIVDFLAGLAGTMTVIPINVAILSLVEPRDKPMSLALMGFLGSILSNFPAPLLYGKVIDSTCIRWKENCGEVGACALYDLPSLRLRMKGMDIGFQLLQAVFYLIGFLLFKFGYGVGREKIGNPSKDNERIMSVRL